MDNHCYSYKHGKPGVGRAPEPLRAIWLPGTPTGIQEKLLVKFRERTNRISLFMAVAVGLITGTPLPVLAASASVEIGSFYFSPANVSINVNDQVNWTWVGSINHSTTSTGGLWDSGLHNGGYSYSHMFTAAGSFPYKCTLHPLSMQGTVSVAAAADVPPTVAITGPKQGATFAAPWNGKVEGTDGDADGTVAKVDVLAGTTLLGTVNSPGLNFSVPVSLSAGTYTLTAVATDNNNAATTSGGVTISVVAPTPIVLSSAQRMSDTAFQFIYTADPGLTYVVSRSGDLVNWSGISTNTATSGRVTFVDTGAIAAVNYYRVALSPNP